MDFCLAAFEKSFLRALRVAFLSQMVKALFATGGIFLILGLVSRLESADGILRLIPALVLLPLGRTFVAGPDLPPYLTQEGIIVAYFVPGVLLTLVGAVLWYRRS